jgi:hypothetical protein
MQHPRGHRQHLRRPNPDIIVIRGAPGSGKTQASKYLAAWFPRGVRIEVDALRAMVISVAWTNQAEHINILSLSTGLVLGFLSLGYRPVIVVDTFSGNKLMKFLTDIFSRNDSLDVRGVALVTAPEVLKARVENRPEDQFKNLRICQKLNSEVVKYLQPFEQLIDNTSLTPQETARAIQRGLNPQK